MKVSIEDTCTACGLCCDTCPEVFEIGLDQPQKFKVQFPTLAEIEGMTDDELIDAVANGAYANNAVSAKLKEMFASMPGSDNGKGNGNGHGPN